MDFELDEEDSYQTNLEMSQREPHQRNKISDISNNNGYNVFHNKSNKNQSYNHDSYLQNNIKNNQNDIHKKKSLYESDYQLVQETNTKQIKTEIRNDGNFSKIKNPLSTNCTLNNLF